MKLMRIKGWEIHSNSNEDLNNIHVTGHHVACPSNKNKEISWFANEDPQCWNCQTKVPDEIQCLMYLHEEMDAY